MDDAGEVRIVIGEWLTRFLQEKQSDIAGHTLAGMLLNAKMSLALDQGRTFELGTALTLAARLKIACGKKLSEIPLLGLSKVIADSGVAMEEFLGIRAVPGFTTKKGEEEDGEKEKEKKKKKKKTRVMAAAAAAPEEKKEKKKTFGVSEWPKFQEQAAPFAVLFPEIKNSHGPDLLLNVKQVWIHFALKALLSTGKSSVAHIAEEVEKCLVIPRSCEEGADTPLVLFFLSTQLDENIQEAMGTSDSLVLSPGVWGQTVKGTPLVVSRKTLNKQTTKKTNNKKHTLQNQHLTKKQRDSAHTKFEVPPGCEVVIPSLGALHKFFGEGQLKKLGEFFNTTTGHVQMQLNTVNAFHASLLSSESVFPGLFFSPLMIIFHASPS